MPRFAANISMLFNEVPFLERFGAAAKGGFKGVEYFGPYDYPVDQIAGLAKQVKELKATSEAVAEENKLFKNEIDKKDKEIALLRGNVADPVLPATAQGKVLVVDPKWDFLVLDVGGKRGLVERGVLLISRNGALVAKVRVTNVQPDRCIANIMPGWKLKDVMEGDQVFPYAPKSTL